MFGKFFGGNNTKPKDDKPDDKEFNIFSDDDETITGYKNADTPNNPVMKGKTLSGKVKTADNIVSNIEPVSETTDGYIDEPDEEEDTKEIKDVDEFDDDPEAVAGIDTRANSEEISDDDELGMLAENIIHDAYMDSFRDIEKNGLLNEMPPAVIEEEKASQKLAAKIVAKEEPKKNLALLSNTLANLPTSIMPYVADSVASTLLDAKDENGLPIFESKNEIIKLLKDLRNSKLRKGSKSGKKKVGKTKSSKGKHERDYMDYMLTKRINPAILITPKMRH